MGTAGAGDCGRASSAEIAIEGDAIGRAEGDDTVAEACVGCIGDGADTGCVGDPAAADDAAADDAVDPANPDSVANADSGDSGGGVGAATGGGGGNVGTAMPGGGAATASGSSINSTGRSGSCSSNGEVLDVADDVAAAGVWAGGASAGALAVTVPPCGAEGVAGEDRFTVEAATAIGGSEAAGGNAFLVPVEAVSARRASEGPAAGAGETFGADPKAAVGAGATGWVGVGVVPPLTGIAMGLDAPANVAPARRVDAALEAAAILRWWRTPRPAAPP